MLPEWSVWVGKIVDRYKERITAYEVWNEPTMGTAPNGHLSSEQYAALLNHTSPIIRQYNPKAKIVGFAGVPLSYMKSTMALGVSSLMDVVSEHSYAEINRPEANNPKQTAAVREILAAHGGNKPIWHTEQGVRGDDDGYMPPSISEGDVAALYTRNLVTLQSLGVGKYFWFSAQTSPTYGYAVFYENYIPRPRLAALNACAYFLEGAKYRRTFHPVKDTNAHLFEGAAPVCVVWNMNLPAKLRLPIGRNSVQAFDLMGTPVDMAAEQDGIAIELPVERPVYVRCVTGGYDMLEKALAAAKVVEVEPVGIADSHAVATGIQVTVASRSKSAQDGIVEVVAPGGAKPAGWPAPQHFHGLAPGGSQTFTFAVPDKNAGDFRVRFGDREMRELKATCAGR